MNWQDRAVTRDECLNKTYGRFGCRLPGANQDVQNANFDVKWMYDETDCDCLGGIPEYVYTWTPGVWQTGTPRPLTWISPSEVTPYEWRNATSFFLLESWVANSVEQDVIAQLQSQLVCEENVVTNSLTTLVCDCLAADSPQGFFFQLKTIMTGVEEDRETARQRCCSFPFSSLPPDQWVCHNGDTIFFYWSCFTWSLQVPIATAMTTSSHLSPQPKCVQTSPPSWRVPVVPWLLIWIVWCHAAPMSTCHWFGVPPFPRPNHLPLCHLSLRGKSHRASRWIRIKRPLGSWWATDPFCPLSDWIAFPILKRAFWLKPKPSPTLPTPSKTLGTPRHLTNSFTLWISTWRTKLWTGHFFFGVSTWVCPWFHHPMMWSDCFRSCEWRITNQSRRSTSMTWRWTWCTHWGLAIASISSCSCCSCVWWDTQSFSPRRVFRSSRGSRLFSPFCVSSESCFAFYGQWEDSRTIRSHSTQCLKFPHFCYFPLWLSPLASGESCHGRGSFFLPISDESFNKPREVIFYYYFFLKQLFHLSFFSAFFFRETDKTLYALVVFANFLVWSFFAIVIIVYSEEVHIHKLSKESKRNIHFIPLRRMLMLLSHNLFCFLSMDFRSSSRTSRWTSVLVVLQHRMSNSSQTRMSSPSSIKPSSSSSHSPSAHSFGSWVTDSSLSLPKVLRSLFFSSNRSNISFTFFLSTLNDCVT